MAWFGEGFSNLKGQLTNFTKEVLAEGRNEITDDLPTFQRKVEELEALCASQELEITRLNGDGDRLRRRLEEFQVPLPEQGSQNGSAEAWWSVQHWNLPNTSNADQSASQGGAASTEDLHDELLQKQKLLQKEKKKCEGLEQNVQKLSSELTTATTFKDKWQEAEGKVKELEADLQKVQQQLLEHLRSSQTNTSELRAEVEDALRQLHGTSTGNGELLHGRQDLVNHIIQISRKSRDAEVAMKKLQDDGRKLLEDATNIVQKLGDPQQQDVIQGALKALELENQVLKLRNAQLEDEFIGNVEAETPGNADSLEVVLRNNEEHVQQMQRQWAEEKLALEKNLFQLYEKIEKYEEKTSMLEKEKGVVDAELEAMTAVVQDLEAQLAASREESATLTSGLEELDRQQQDAINQVLTAKKSLQDDNDRLTEELKAAKQKQVEVVSTVAQTEEDDRALDSLLHDKIMEVLTFEIPEEYYSRRSWEGKGLQVVAALVKMSAECKWQRDTLERKVTCLMKELHDCREERDALLELSQAGGLPPIPEHSEEAEALGQKLAALEEQVTALAESRSNLEADAERLREDNRKLADLLQAAEESLRNEKNLHAEDSTKLNMNISELEQKLKSTVESYEKADEQWRLTQLLLIETKDKLELEIREKSACKLKFDDCDLERSTLQQELDQVSTKLASLGDVDTLKQDYLDLEKKHAVSLSELQERNGDLESRNSVLVQEVETLKDRLSNIAEQMEEPVKVCDNLKLVVHEKDNEIKELKLTLDRHTTEASEISVKFKELVDKHKYVQDELEKSHLCKKQMEVELKDLQDKVFEQRNSVDIFKDHLAKKDTHCDELACTNAELQERLTKLVLECSDWKDSTHTAEQQLEEVVNMKSAVEDECRRLLQVEMQVQEDLKKEATSLSMELVSVKQHLLDAQQTSSELELKVQEREHELNLLHDQVSGLTIAVSKANDDLEAEKQTRLRLDAECCQFQLALDQARCEAVELKRLYDQTVVGLENSKRTAELSRVDGVQPNEISKESRQELKHLQASQSNQFAGDTLAMVPDSNITAEEGENPIKGFDTSQVHREVESLMKNLDVGEAVLNLLKRKLFEVVFAKNSFEYHLDVKVRECDSLKAKLTKLEQDNEVLSRHDGVPDTAMETISQLSEVIKMRDLEKEVLSASLDRADEERTRLRSEQDELVALVRQKHQENVHYHAEIQRLTALLTQEAYKVEESRQQQCGLQLQFEDKQKMLLNTQNELISVRQRLEKLEALAQNAEALQTVQKTVADLQAELSSKEDIIRRNCETLTSCENVIQTKDQELQLLKSLVTQLQLQGEDFSVQESSLAENGKVDDLESKLASVSDVLRDEQNTNKYLEHEVQDLREKEAGLRKELDRLRQHLVGVEESYTQEALRLEAHASGLRQQVLLAEERIKNSSTAYTSVSIRANQQVETLQEQVRLVSQQRDDIQQRLSSTEDQMERQAAALTNLQAVLKQFHRDKEREIMFETDRIRQQLQASYAKENELAAEIKSLKGQLQEAKDGLSAAARLGEQLDRKTNLVGSLREDVLKLKQQLGDMEANVHAASQSSEGKVDRSLVKNLVLGYFAAPAKSRTDVLRVVATVLDFSEDERTRAGLPQGAAQHSPSLSEAFIKFLENESQPQLQLRLLPERKVSQSSEPGKTENTTPGRRTPLLLHDVQLPSFSQFPVSRNSSSILKDVLKDS